MADSLALTRMNGNRAQRETNVPAFLNKLYNMVNDPKIDDLIRWSEDGESFVVPDAERVGKEVFPHYFKHAKFASFVRQLNMYGFHKVPQLQQGVLKSGTNTELWQFRNANFKRGRPDLMELIPRKKGNEASTSGTSAAPSDPLTGASGSSSLDGTSSQAGPLALHSLAGELAAIRQHQSTISAELTALKMSNNQLWQKTLTAQELHKKQQDTIERILKFLAGVFGNSASDTNRASTPDNRPSSDTSVARRNNYLLIANGKARATPDFSFADSPEPTNRFTEESATPSVLLAASPSMSTASNTPKATPGSVSRPLPERQNSQQLTRRHTPSPPLPSSPSGSQTMSDNDLAFQASFAQLVNNNPQFLSSLAQLQYPPPSPSSHYLQGVASSFPDTNPFPSNDSYSNLGLDLNGFSGSTSDLEFGDNAFSSDFLMPSADDIYSFAHTPSQAPGDHINNIYRSADQVEADVEHVQQNIDAILSELGRLDGFDSPTASLPSAEDAAENAARFSLVMDGSDDKGAIASATAAGASRNNMGDPNSAAIEGVDIDSLLNDFTGFDAAATFPDLSKDPDTASATTTPMPDSVVTSPSISTSTPLVSSATPTPTAIVTPVEDPLSPLSSPPAPDINLPQPTASITTRSKRKSDILHSPPLSMPTAADIPDPDGPSAPKKLRGRKKKI